MILGVDLGLSVALHFSDNRMATFVTDLRVIIVMILIILRIWSWYSQGGYDLISSRIMIIVMIALKMVMILSKTLSSGYD